MRVSGAFLPWLAAITAALLAWGLYDGLLVAPPDYQQGETVRIMYVHVPSAYLSMMIFGSMAFASAVALIWRHPVADIAAKAEGVLQDFFVRSGLDPDSAIIYAGGLVGMVAHVGAWWAPVQQPDAATVAAHITALAYHGLKGLPSNPVASLDLPTPTSE